MINTDKLGTLPTVIPEALKFRVPRQGPSGARKEVKMPPENTSYSTSSNNIVRFFFTNSDIIDFSRGGIAFDVTITPPPGATYCRLAQGAWSLFNRVRLTNNGRELEDIREYNRLHSLLFESTREPDVGAVLGSVYGYGTQAQRNAWGATPSKDYMTPLLCGLFLSGPVPTEVFTKRLQLELYLEDPRKCIETDGVGVPVITLTNIQFHFEVLFLSEPTRTSFVAQAMSGSKYPYKSFIFYQQNITGARSDIAIPHASEAIDGFINFMVDATTVNDMTVNNKFLTWNNNQCTDHTLKINNEFWPVEPCLALDDPQSYLMYLRWIEKWKIGGTYTNPPTISFEDYNQDRFLIIYQLEAFPGEGLVNQLSTTNGGNNVFLRLNLAVNPVNQALYTFVQVSRTIDLVGTTLRQ
jgi:hypothetical protein